MDVENESFKFMIHLGCEGGHVQEYCFDLERVGQEELVDMSLKFGITLRRNKPLIRSCLLCSTYHDRRPFSTFILIGAFKQLYKFKYILFFTK